MSEDLNRKAAESYLAAAQSSQGAKSQRDALMAIATTLMSIETHLSLLASPLRSIEQNLALLASPTKTSFTHIRHEPPLPPLDQTERRGTN